MKKYYDVKGNLLTYKDIKNLLKTAESVEELDAQRKMFSLYMPPVMVMFDYDQQNYTHQYDLWTHCLHTVVNLTRNIHDDMLYLAALLHDIGKPDCQCRGTRKNDTNMHYYGHPQRSMEIVRDSIIPLLAEKGVILSKDEQRRLLYYVAYHDDRVSLRRKHLRRHLQIASLEEFKNLMYLQAADAKAHIMLPIVEERIRICETWANGYADELYNKVF